MLLRGSSVLHPMTVELGSAAICRMTRGCEQHGRGPKEKIIVEQLEMD